MSDAPPPATPSITETQYRAAVEALGLDPDLVVSVTLGSQWVTISQVKLHDGKPVVELGQVVTEQVAGPLVAEGD